MRTYPRPNSGPDVHLEFLSSVHYIRANDVAGFELKGDDPAFHQRWIWVARESLVDGQWFMF
jgi:hypothetical protein